MLGGFSQGAVMSFAVGPRQGAAPPRGACSRSPGSSRWSRAGELDNVAALPADRARARQLRPGDSRRARPPRARAARGGRRRGALPRVADRPRDRPGVRGRAAVLARGTRSLHSGAAEGERLPLLAHLLEALLAEERTSALAAPHRDRQRRVALPACARSSERRRELRPDALPLPRRHDQRSSSRASPRRGTRSPGPVSGKSRNQAAPTEWPPSIAISAVSPRRPQPST